VAAAALETAPGGRWRQGPDAASPRLCDHIAHVHDCRRRRPEPDTASPPYVRPFLFAPLPVCSPACLLPCLLAEKGSPCQALASGVPERVTGRQDGALVQSQGCAQSAAGVQREPSSEAVRDGGQDEEGGG
jgi:hypothetical protein